VPEPTTETSADFAAVSASRNVIRSPWNPAVEAFAMLFEVASRAFDWATAPAAAM
jgi:hypothetical protein